MDASWQSDGVTLYLGDCLEVLPSLGTVEWDLVATDPPYIVAVNSSAYGKNNPWADMVNAAWWFAQWMRQCRRILKPTGALWSFMNWKSLPIYQKAAFEADWKIESVLVWDKEWIGPGGSVGLRPSYEMVGLFPGDKFSIEDRGIPDIRRCAWSSFKPNGHPAEKPMALMRWLLEISGAASVVDPFMGSGSTIAAAVELGIPAVGIELDPGYFEIARKRIEQAQMQMRMAI